jgi:hypothetical protein
MPDKYFSYLYFFTTLLLCILLEGWTWLTLEALDLLQFMGEDELGNVRQLVVPCYQAAEGAALMLRMLAKSSCEVLPILHSVAIPKGFS